LLIYFFSFQWLLTITIQTGSDITKDGPSDICKHLDPAWDNTLKPEKTIIKKNCWTNTGAAIREAISVEDTQL